jgi:uncharacterized protein (TIGR03435 family)
MRHGMRGGPGTDDPTLFTCENCGLAALVILAYEIKDYQYSGPEWTQFTHFIVSATIPPGTTKEQFRGMMQNLLADRFKLTVHHKKKDMVASYDLVVAKNGQKFKEAVEAPPPADDTPRQLGGLKTDANGFPALPHGQGYTMAITKGRAALHSDKESMPAFAEKLSGQLRQPVNDATGLKGKYDITLYWVTELTPSADEPGPTIFQALQEQLGYGPGADGRPRGEDANGELGCGAGHRPAAAHRAALLSSGDRPSRRRKSWPIYKIAGNSILP